MSANAFPLRLKLHSCIPGQLANGRALSGAGSDNALGAKLDPIRDLMHSVEAAAASCSSMSQRAAPSLSEVSDKHCSHFLGGNVWRNASKGACKLLPAVAIARSCKQALSA